jgi:hypothetical protein
LLVAGVCGVFLPCCLGWCGFLPLLLSSPPPHTHTFSLVFRCLRREKGNVPSKGCFVL